MNTATKLLLLLSGRRLPRTNLLIYLARPNSDYYLVGEDTEIGEETYIWGYVLPESLFAELGEGVFFEADGTPIVALATEIAADPNINTDNVFFVMKNKVQQTGRLAIYASDALQSVLDKACKVLGIYPIMVDGVQLTIDSSKLIVVK